MPKAKTARGWPTAKDHLKPPRLVVKRIAVKGA